MEAIKENQTKKYNLKNDVIFKAFFGKKGNEQFLIDFLTGLLKINIKEIEIKEEVNLIQLTRDEKGGRLDLQARLDNGSIVNIEIQIKDKRNIIERSIVYGSKVISKELKRGMDYEDAQKVIMVNILNYEIFEYKEYVSESLLVLKDHRDYEISDMIKYYYIELPKYRREKTNMNDKLNQWLALIDDTDRGKIEMAKEKNEKIKSALDEMTYLTGDEEVQRLAELHEKWEMDWNSSINSARKEGITEGMEKGIIKGIKQNQKETAIKMLQKGIDIKTIMEVTELTEEEIKKLRVDK